MGWRCVVARAFQGTMFIDEDLVPSVEEAMWHLMSFVQWMSLPEKQKRHQCHILQPIQRVKDFFGGTSALSHQDHARICGPTGVHSLWNTLPMPPVENLENLGCAHTNPLHILRHAFGLGIAIDDFCVDKDDVDDPIFDRSAMVRFCRQKAQRYVDHYDDNQGRL